MPNSGPLRLANITPCELAFTESLTLPFRTGAIADEDLSPDLQKPPLQSMRENKHAGSSQACVFSKNISTTMALTEIAKPQAGRAIRHEDVAIPSPLLGYYALPTLRRSTSVSTGRCSPLTFEDIPSFP